MNPPYGHIWNRCSIACHARGMAGGMGSRRDGLTLAERSALSGVSAGAPRLRRWHHAGAGTARWSTRTAGRAAGPVSSWPGGARTPRHGRGGWCSLSTSTKSPSWWTPGSPPPPWSRPSTRSPAPPHRGRPGQPALAVRHSLAHSCWGRRHPGESSDAYAREPGRTKVGEARGLWTGARPGERLAPSIAGCAAHPGWPFRAALRQVRWTWPCPCCCTTRRRCPAPTST